METSSNKCFSLPHSLSNFNSSSSVLAFKPKTNSRGTDLTRQTGPGCQVLSASLYPDLLQGPLGYHNPPSSLISSPVIGLDYTTTSCSPIFNPAIWLPRPFCLFLTLLTSYSGSPFFSLPSPHGLTQSSQAHSGLPQMSLPLAILSLLSTINFLLGHT